MSFAFRCPDTRMNVWDQIKQRLAAKLTPESYRNWLEKTQFLRIENGVVFVAVPHAAAREWVEDEYGPTIVATMKEMNLPYTGITCELASAPEKFHQPFGTPSEELFSAPALQFNPRFTFETFVVGSCNQFAHAAAKAVATMPARTYNPLFIYGGVGMGKTHLMHAIGQSLTGNFTGLRVVYTTSERFMNHLIRCIRTEQMSLFRQHYRRADVLLVDDIHILANKERTQEEFFHTFNELYERQKQIVISSDSPPKHTPGLVERLRSRFEWGLMVDIQPPDLETKMAILDRKAEIEGIQLPEDVRIFIATKTRSNVRELEGALVKLLAYSSVTGTEINIHMARQALKHLTFGDERKISIEAIIRQVAERFNLSPAQLKQRTNLRRITHPRQIAMYLAKELTGASLPEIGRAFGGKHHTTVLHGVQRIDQLRQKDPDLNRLMHSLIDSLT